MGETLKQRRRVNDEGLRIVKFNKWEKISP
jgi:hypothetical protein